ncbi:MAG: hypothetical protein SynsKO_07220 [Synoicihabitans sp.]
MGLILIGSALTVSAEITAEYGEVSQNGMNPNAEGDTNRNWNFNTTAITTFNDWQYCAYWNNGDIVNGERRYRVELARRPLNSSEGWTPLILPGYYRNQDTDPPHSAAARFGDGHEKVSLGISPDGYLHLVFDLHVDHLHYVRSNSALALSPTTTPWEADQFEDVRRSLDPDGTLITRVTYPRFYADYETGRFALHLRTGGSGSGDTHLFDYDASRQIWDIDSIDSSRFLDNETTAYPDGTVNAYPVLKPIGNTIHMLWTWRGTPDAGTCFDIAHAYSTDFGSEWRDGQGNLIGIRGSADGSADLISADDPGVTAVDLDLNRVFNSNFTATLNHRKDIYVYYQDRQTGDRYLRIRTAENGQDQGGSWGEALPAPRVSNPLLVAAPNGSIFLVSKSGLHRLDEDGSLILERTPPSAANYGPANLSIDPQRLQSEGVISVIGQNSGQTVFVVDYGNLPGPTGETLNITANPASRIAAPGESVTLSVAATSTTSTPLTYQWRRNGLILPGANSAQLTLTHLEISQSGNYTVEISDGASTVLSNPANLNVTTLAPGRLRNLSVRSRSGSGASALVAGFVIADGSAEVLVRGVGPGLGPFGVTSFAVDPELELYSGQDSMAFNQDWAAGTTTARDQIITTGAAVGAFALDVASKDAAIITELAGPHTAHVRSQETGIALAEIYEIGQGTGKLSNVSARTFTGPGADVLIAGFVIEGDLPKQLLIRAVGPELVRYGVDGTLTDPLLRLYDSAENLVAENDDWAAEEMGTYPQQVGAFGLTPYSKDSAFIATLTPGSYTVHVSSANEASGIALVEIYELL